MFLTRLSTLTNHKIHFQQILDIDSVALSRSLKTGTSFLFVISSLFYLCMVNRIPESFLLGTNS